MRKVVQVNDPGQKARPKSNNTYICFSFIAILGWMKLGLGFVGQRGVS